MKSLLLISVIILAVGCGEKNESTAHTKPVKEKVLEVKPTEEAPLNPNLKYEIKGDSVTITDCDEGVSGKLVISSTIEGKLITSIGDYAFSECSSLTSIKIPDSVTRIGDEAFISCWKLTSIMIPDGVTNLGDGAFGKCSRLKKITIPDGVTSIREMAFALCTSLTVVTFHGDAPKVGNDVLLNATPTIYRKPEAKGWGDTWGGRPVKLISEKP